MAARTLGPDTQQSSTIITRNNVRGPGPYSLGPSRFIVRSNANITTNPVAIAGGMVSRSRICTVVADPGNTDYVLVGSDAGSCLIRLNAGDSLPLFDSSPAEVWAKSNSGTQVVQFIGSGEPL